MRIILILLFVFIPNITFAQIEELIENSYYTDSISTFYDSKNRESSDIHFLNRKFLKHYSIGFLPDSVGVIIIYTRFDKGFTMKYFRIKQLDIRCYSPESIKIDNISVNQNAIFNLEANGFYVHHSRFMNNVQIAKSKIKNLEINVSTFNNRFFYSGNTFRFLIVDRNKFVNNSFFFDAVLGNAFFLVNNDFNSDLRIANCQLPETFYFRSNRFKSDVYKIDLTKNKLDSIRHSNLNSYEKCKIFLDPLNASNVIVDSKSFIIGEDSTYSYEDMLTVYEKVLRTCRDLGMDESVEEFDTQYQIFKIRHKYGIFDDSIVWFQDYWWGYGYKRSNILQNIIYAFIASLVIFFIGYKKVFRAYSPNSDHDPETVIKECADSALERFKVVFFYTAMVFFSWKVEHARVDYRRYPWIALMIYTIYVIGLIHLAYLAAFVLAK
ncbi:hypothetical protein [Siphonobacter sp. SORGH_AS_1065]|uniref:hypothetical protein n=1 Tax=Siphonobacter sp. SORGH_AS_1065 TaxID=3041795 RepID=UPI002787EB4F|nr:hypothetical protein [Siphonobacter sp. SORGH_AS_1065]MDQ1088615.1 hypothetical protein [Siphonobacter sp. SORGH_AS_1065]